MSGLFLGSSRVLRVAIFGICCTMQHGSGLALPGLLQTLQRSGPGLQMLSLSARHPILGICALPVRFVHSAWRPYHQGTIQQVGFPNTRAHTASMRRRSVQCAMV
mmetsp:Transcript_168443/g.409432  ORF Transcript_168443/g.409432 Transcript_168443/m.409432 type:complete len:105 (+) Transcript_168443:398-712(+)